MPCIGPLCLLDNLIGSYFSADCYLTLYCGLHLLHGSQLQISRALQSLMKFFCLLSLSCIFYSFELAVCHFLRVSNMSQSLWLKNELCSFLIFLSLTKLPPASPDAYCDTKRFHISWLFMGNFTKNTCPLNYLSSRIHESYQILTVVFLFLNTALLTFPGPVISTLIFCS